MESPTAIANYFIGKSFNTGQELTPIKLIKLVYIAHGWYLALTGDPLISEAVQAWEYGPVLPSIYNKVKIYGDKQITSYISDTNKGDLSSNYPTITESTDENIQAGKITGGHIITKAILDKIWEVYSKYNGLELSTLTHEKGSPWDTVWNKEDGKKNRCSIIPNDSIAFYYKQKAFGDAH